MDSIYHLCVFFIQNKSHWLSDVGTILYIITGKPKIKRKGPCSRCHDSKISFKPVYGISPINKNLLTFFHSSIYKGIGQSIDSLTKLSPTDCPSHIGDRFYLNKRYLIRIDSGILNYD